MTVTLSPLSLKDADANSLTTDNLERHGQLSHHPALPDGGALLSEAKLQSIMSFLDEMEKSEQERPRSVTSGSHREVRFEAGTLLVFFTASFQHLFFSLCFLKFCVPEQMCLFFFLVLPHTVQVNVVR